MPYKTGLLFGAVMVLIYAIISFLVSGEHLEINAAATTTVTMPLGSSAATRSVGYEPPEVTVSPGASVIWDNQDNALHTATSGDPDTATPDGKFDTGIVGANQPSKPVTMPTQPGEYKYFCTLHPFLVGTVTVSASLDTNQTEEETTIQVPSAPLTSITALLTIPNGASVQGNPGYEPSQLTVKVGDTIAVENKDIAPHTVTNGKDATDPNMGQLFDTSIINAGDSAEIVTADLKPGGYPYFCSVHPYHKGTLTIQSIDSSSLDGSEITMDEKTPAISADGQMDDIDAISTNRSDLLIPILNDATEYLKNGDNEGALVYMSFLRN